MWRADFLIQGLHDLDGDLALAVEMAQIRAAVQQKGVGGISLESQRPLTVW
jgi:hypothetical protein